MYLFLIWVHQIWLRYRLPSTVIDTTLLSGLILVGPLFRRAIFICRQVSFQADPQADVGPADCIQLPHQVFGPRPSHHQLIRVDVVFEFSEHLVITEGCICLLYTSPSPRDRG